MHAEHRPMNPIKLRYCPERRAYC